MRTLILTLALLAAPGALAAQAAPQRIEDHPAPRPPAIAQPPAVWSTRNLSQLRSPRGKERHKKSAGVRAVAASAASRVTGKELRDSSSKAKP